MFFEKRKSPIFAPELMYKRVMSRRDSIDWGKTSVNRLYLKVLIPTLLGMVSGIIVTITDGYFVGQYAGSDALAAVNVAAPVFLISTAFALLFGVGSSVVASIHLSQGRSKAANINITQAVIVSELLFIILSLLLYFNSETVAVWFGATERLLPLVDTYLNILSLSLIFYMLMNLGLFIIRLDGSPIFAMMCTVVPATINIIADYYLVAYLDMGLTGAVIATSGSFVIGGLIVLWYLLFKAKNLKLYRLKLSARSLQLTMRNIGYMCRLGFSAMLSEMAIAVMMFVGNYVFLEYYMEDGVAAFSVVCYYFPIIFMVLNAMAQSAQPIISFNSGTGAMNRVRRAFKLTLIYALCFALVVTLGVALFANHMVALFIDSANAAYTIAVGGLPYFATGYIFLAINMIYTGYFQSIERYKIANIISFIRGFIFMPICFVTLPMVIGDSGVWFAVPLVEVLTATMVLVVVCRKK